MSDSRGTVGNGGTGGNRSNGDHRGCFVRALWGDRLIPIFQQVLDEVTWCLEQPHQPAPTAWYAYGWENYKWLKQHGCDAELLDELPFRVFANATAEENADPEYITRYGSSMWRHKYPAIREALRHYPAVVWMDLDTVLTGPLPKDFWGRMAAGAEFQCTLQQNFRKRAGWRGLDNEPRKTPGGNWMYFRGTNAIDRLLRLYEEHPGEWDLTVLARLTDELMGGTWLGSAAYKEQGYEPYCHSLGRRAGRQIYPPEETLFLTHWRKTGLVKIGKRGSK